MTLSRLKELSTIREGFFDFLKKDIEFSHGLSNNGNQEVGDTQIEAKTSAGKEKIKKFAAAIKMKKITDKDGIEISTVNISPDFSQITFDTNTHNFENIEKLFVNFSK